jgi:hypothetical protein
MKFINILFLSAILLFTTSFNALYSDVYICKGKYSKKYHYVKNCRGLSNCSTDIYKASLSEAKDLGRSLCGWED